MHLSVQNGPQAGTAVPLQREEPVTIGRGEDSRLLLQDPAAPERAAVVKALKGEGFGVKALAPGLRLNGEEIQAARLQEGDVLEIGGTRIAVEGERAADNGKTRLGGFRLLEELGRGGMGVVYRAEQISLHRQVALKVLSQDLTRDPVFVARFVAEARAAARLHHPNVVQVFDVDHDGDTYFYSMELMHEGSLEAWLRRHGKMPPEQAVQVVADAAAGLGYAESLRIVHRDIKPDNLMLDQHGTVKIADLGLALSEEDDGGKLHGTPHFMAPEQVLRRPVDHRTDLYALGCTFYRLITGRTPFSGSTVKEILRAQVKEEPEPPHKVDPEIPIEVSAIVQRLLQKDPDERYQSATELLEDLQALLAPPSRKGLVIAAVAGAVLVAGGALAFALTREQAEPTVIEKYRDNPEAQRLARENDELKAEVALLRTRLKGERDEALAKALDAVAAAHPGTAAAAEATAEAEVIRKRLAAARAAEQARARALAEAVMALEQQTRAAIAEGAFGRALELLAAGPIPEELRAETAVAEAREALRQELQAAAQSLVEQRLQAVAAARQQGEPEALAAALQDLEALLQGEAALPQELLADRESLAQALAEGRAEVEALRQKAHQQRLARTWQDYEGVLLGEVLPAAARFDFGGAAGRLRGFVDELDEGPAAARARDLAAGLEMAEGFARRLEAVVKESGLQFRMGDGAVVPLVRLQRSSDPPGLVVRLGKGRQAKDEFVPATEVGDGQWAELSEKVLAAGGDDDLAASRDAFLGFLALAEQARIARQYLQRLRPDADESGTGAEGYAGSPIPFERLLRRLPGDRPWARALAGELAAGRTLAAGLRALSERRNLAAASYLERLLAEHPHSLLVVALR